MNKIIEIIVTPTGETSVQTKGFAGAECRQASQFVEIALGQVTSDQPTSELHQSQTEQRLKQQCE